MLLRHGEPEYALVAGPRPKYRGHRYDLVHLSDQGVRQIHAVIAEVRDFDAELIASSPYPRCLQSAAILSRALDLDLHVHPDLHEWLPVSDGEARVTAEIVAQAEEAYWRNRSTPGSLIGTPWESDAAIVARTRPILDEYKGGCQRLLVVTHEVVIRALTGQLHTGLGAACRLTW